MKKRLVTIMLSLCLAISLAVPAGAVMAGEDTAGLQGDSNRMLSSVLSNASFLNELKNEAPSADLINANNVTSYGEDYVTFEKNTLLGISVDGDVTTKEYQKEVAGVYYTGADVEIPSNPGDVSPAASGTISDDNIDSTASVRIYSTIYYTTSTNSGREMIELTKVTGYYNRTATGVSVSKQAVRIGQTGFTIGDYVTQYRDYAPVNSSWSYIPPSDWEPIGVADYRVIGADYEVTLKRGTSTWSVILTNNYP